MPHLSPRFQKALSFAAEKHDGQYRKGGNVPYITHPVLVAFTVLEYTKEEDVVSAALLHDTLEDCPDVTVSLLQKEFGDRVASIVEELSAAKSGKAATWREKKEAYLAKITHASKDTLLIVAADKMVNMQAYFEMLQSGNNAAMREFGGTPDGYRWYYGEIGKIIASTLGDHPIVAQYSEIFAKHR